MKRFLSFTAMLCSICILFSSCYFFLPGLDRALEDWNDIMQDALDSLESSIADDPYSWDDGPSYSQDDTVGAARTVDELERKYGFEIEDPDRLLSDENGEENCAILDETLEIFSKPLIKGFLRSLWRRDCAFSMEFVDEHSDSLGETSYRSDLIHIKIFAPRNTPDPSVTNGITVETIAHELGHAIHDALEYQYGMDEVEDIWTSLNGGYEYGEEWEDGCEAFFAYEYGMTDYYEDVATVFEDLAAFSLVMSSKLSQQEYDPLYMKVKYLYSMMDETFDLSESTLFDAYEAAATRRGDRDGFDEAFRQFDAYQYGRYAGTSIRQPLSAA